MVDAIEDFHNGKIQFYDLVYILEGALDAGEFSDKHLVQQWYDYWTPLEILAATKGDKVTMKDVGKHVFAMESFLKNFIPS